MRHRVNKAILSRMKGPREALLRNLATSVILYEKVKTTKARAKFVRPLVEKAITVGKTKSVNTIRQLNGMFMVKNAIKKVVEELGPKYKDRKGGYTRILKAGFRHGDNAAVGVIEFVDRDEAAKGLDSGPVQERKVDEDATAAA